MIFNIKGEDLKKKIDSALWVEDIYKHMLKQCEMFMEKERPYVIVGDGIKGSAARAYGAKMAMLITAGLITGDRAYTEKAKDMLLYAAESVDVEYYKRVISASTETSSDNLLLDSNPNGAVLVRFIFTEQ